MLHVQLLACVTCFKSNEVNHKENENITLYGKYFRKTLYLAECLSKTS